MGIVFIVLIALAYMLDVLKLIANKDKTKKEVKTVETIEETSEIEEDIDTEDENELLAVISAAIALVIGSQSNLVIKSIMRTNDQTPIWAKAGRQDQMLNRL